MKKYLLALMVMCFTCLSAAASNPVNYTKGDKKFFSKGQGTASLVINWSNATFENTKSVQDEFGADWGAAQQAAATEFSKALNKENKNLSIVDGAADYQITINVKSLERKSKLLKISWSYGPATIMCGTLTVTDKSGAVVVECELDNVEGQNDYTPVDGLGKCFKKLAEKL